MSNRSSQASLTSSVEQIWWRWCTRTKSGIELSEANPVGLAVDQKRGCRPVVLLGACRRGCGGSGEVKSTVVVPDEVVDKLVVLAASQGGGGELENRVAEADLSTSEKELVANLDSLTTLMG